MLRLLTCLLLAVSVGLCLGAPTAMATPQPHPALGQPMAGGHMDDCAPAGGAMAVCTSCNAILPPAPAISPVRYTAPAIYAERTVRLHLGAVLAPDPPVPRREA